MLARAGAPVGVADCAADLPAQVGATVTCTLTGAGGSADRTVRTTSVDGGKVDYFLERAGLR